MNTVDIYLSMLIWITTLLNIVRLKVVDPLSEISGLCPNMSQNVRVVSNYFPQ